MTTIPSTAAAAAPAVTSRLASVDLIRGAVMIQPFFFYVLHIPLIHASAVVVSPIRLGAVSPWLFANHPMGNPPPPDGYTWSLGFLYLVWAVAIVLLYFPCRWFADLKARKQDRWLKYL